MTMDFGFDGAPRELVLNVANDNGLAIQRMLGVERPDWAGSMNPMLLLVALERAVAAEHATPTTDNHGVAISADGVRPVARIIDCGRTEQQVQRYIDQLRIIATAASAELEDVTWG